MLDSRNMMMNKTNVIPLFIESTTYGGMQSINHGYTNNFLTAPAITALNEEQRMQWEYLTRETDLG